MLCKLLHPELSYRINGLCFQIHNELGCFAKEKQYADHLEQLLTANEINYQRELKTPFKLEDGKEIQGNITDFIVEGKIIIECKAKNFITKVDYYQIQRYLQSTNLELGLLVNFHERHLKPKRVLNYRG